MPTVTANGTTLYYETHGQGAPVMPVPGLGGLGSYWRPQIPAFSHRYRVIVHDHRGTGRSEWASNRYSVEQMAADTLALMDALGLERVHFVGHSTGGAIGQILAIEAAPAPDARPRQHLDQGRSVLPLVLRGPPRAAPQGRTRCLPAHRPAVPVPTLVHQSARRSDQGGAGGVGRRLHHGRDREGPDRCDPGI
jgi:pimeloyl-ACP methyl ester carboxylesterase